MNNSVSFLLAVVAFLFVGCTTSYQKDVTQYERITPFVSDNGEVLEEVTSFKSSLNQEREFQEITIAVDSEYTYNPDNLTFTQPDSSRGGGFYMQAVGYRTKVNVESIAEHTDRDEAIVDDVTGLGESVADLVIP